MQMFGLGAYPGLRECLEDDLPLATSIYHLENPHFWILPACGVPTNALDLFQSGKLSAPMDQLERLVRLDHCRFTSGASLGGH